MQLTAELRTGGAAYEKYFYYDSAGNRTRKTRNQTDTLYVYNNADQLTSETTGDVTTEYLYDANGALTRSDDGDTVKAYAYDWDGYLTGFEMTGAPGASYVYDADKQRIRKVVESATTKYFLDGMDVIADYDGSDALLASYVTPGLDANLSMTRGQDTYYYMRDGLGSVRNVVGASETVENIYDYRAFGLVITEIEGVEYPYRFTAREYEPDGLSQAHFYRNRYYMPWTGIFMSRDAFWADEHRGWGYVGNRPTMLVDPIGLAVQAFFDCTLIGSSTAGSRKDCEYSCIEDIRRRKERKGCGVFDSDKMPNQPLVIDITVSLYAPRFSRCDPPECPTTTTTTRLYDNVNLPDRDCSRSNCRRGCDSRHQQARMACRLLKKPAAVRACVEAAGVAHRICVDTCNAWCRRD